MCPVQTVTHVSGRSSNQLRVNVKKLQPEGPQSYPTSSSQLVLLPRGRAPTLGASFRSIRSTSMTSFFVNGKPVQVDVDPSTPLLWVLRDSLEMTGTKYGCGMALCGACTVHLDGKAIRSCVTPLSTVAGRKVTTIEGLASTPAKAVQAAWVKLQVPQCGYCQSGQIMSATALLETNSAPTDADIDSAMSGNIRSCATYSRIRAAIHAAADAIKV